MLRHPVTSSSRLWLDEICPAAGVLAQAPSLPSVFGDKGDTVHGYLERVSLVGRDAALAEVPAADRPQLEIIDTSDLPAGDPESAIAFDPITWQVTLLGSGLRRDYSRAPAGTATGTGDKVEQAPGWTAVRDYKTGHNAPDAVGHLQTDSLAAAFAVECWADEAETAIWKLQPDGTWLISASRLGKGELRETRERVTRIYQGILRAEHLLQAGALKPIAGPHCRWCPAAPNCPEMHEGVSTALAAASTIATTAMSRTDPAAALVAALPPAEVGRMWAFVGLLEKEHLPRLKAALTARIKAGGIPAWGHPGRVLQQFWRKERALRPEAVRAMLEPIIGVEAARAATTKDDVTFTGLERTLRALGAEKRGRSWYYNLGGGEWLTKKEVEARLARAGAIVDGGYLTIDAIPA